MRRRWRQLHWLHLPDRRGSPPGTLDASGIYAVGATRVIWTLVDSASNTTTCTQLITVVDNEAPMFACPEDIVATNQPLTCDAFVSIPIPFVTNNCMLDDGHALLFDGADDFVDCGTSDLGITTSITVEAWLMVTNVSQDGALIAKNPTNASWALFLDDDNTAHEGAGLIWRPSTVGAGLAIPSIPVSVWTHIAVVQSGNLARIFVDGVPQTTGPTTPIGGGGGPLTVGAFDGSHFLDGKLDDIRVWNTARTGAEIKADATTQLTGTEPGLVLYYDVEELVNSDRLADQTAGANHGTLTNMDTNSAWCTPGAFPLMFEITNSLTGPNEPSGLFPVGTTLITWAAADLAGNITSCTQSVIVIDGDAPNINCPNTIVVNADPGLCTAGIVLSRPFSVDNCDGAASGTALEFEGINDEVVVGDNPSLSITGVITVEAWIKPTILGVDQGIVEKWDMLDGGYALRLLSGGNIKFATLDEENTFDSVNGITAVQPGVWTHVAGVFNGSSLEVYVNGVLDNVNASSRNPKDGFSPLRIGMRWNMTLPFNGCIDDVRIWSIVRSQADIGSAMSELLTGLETGLNAYYTFEDGYGSQNLTDLTPNGNVGSLVNMNPLNDWVASDAYSGNLTFVNNFNGSDNASDFYPIGTTELEWNVTDGSGNGGVCTQIVVVLPEATDLLVTKEVDNPFVPEGSPVEYTITVTNLSNVCVTGVQVTDMLPLEFDYVDASTTNYSHLSGIWNIGEIPPFGSTQLVIEGDAGFGFPFEIVENTATVTAIDNVDVNSSNDSDDVSFTIQGGVLAQPDSDNDGLPDHWEIA
ncbi:MAG: LamG-like jellyroll fold domain-containing protein, partial [Verrucomicrobiota bacterium]